VLDGDDVDALSLARGREAAGDTRRTFGTKMPSRSRLA